VREPVRLRRSSSIASLACASARRNSSSQNENGGKNLIVNNWIAAKANIFRRRCQTVAIVLPPAIFRHADNIPLPQTEALMPIRTIVRFPDPRLKAACLSVTVFGGDLRMLADDLRDTMRASPGVGITAAHIGILQRVTVIELDRQDGVRIYVNPEIVWFSAESMRHVEGSVSMPGFTDEITRPRAIRLRYQDLDGTTHEAEADGFLATCIQHEVDQLDGVFWLQRLSKLKRDRLIRKWEKSKP
jgi:peptide deformylase